jgi:hypothetical protein
MNLMTMFKIKLLALRNGVILFLLKMTAVYDNKTFSIAEDQNSIEVLQDL